MDMNQFNAAWVDLCIANIKHIKASGVLGEVDRTIRAEGAHLLHPLPIPVLISQHTYDRLERGCRAISAIQLKILRSMQASSSHAHLLEFFEIDPALEPFIDWQELVEQKYMLVRNDILPTRDGGGLICEINSGSLIGGGASYELMKSYIGALGLPLGVGQPSVYLLMCKVIARAMRDKGLDQLVLLVPKKHRYYGMLTLSYYERYMQLAMPGVGYALCDEDSCPPALQQPGQGRHYCVFRLFTSDDILEDMPFYDRLRLSGATLLTGLESDILSSKKWMSLFYDERFRALLDQRELEAIADIAPPSYDLTPANLEHFLDHKDAYMFKLNQSKGGAGVYVGAQSERAELKRILQEQEGWCAQLLIDSGGVELPVVGQRGKHRHQLVLGMYQLGNEVCGMYLRASTRSRIVNVSTGACDGYAFPISEESRRHLLEHGFRGAEAFG